jgi:hypothetical protein
MRDLKEDEVLLKFDNLVQYHPSIVNKKDPICMIVKKSQVADLEKIKIRG